MRQVRPDAILLEIEPKWAQKYNLIQGNILELFLHFDPASFDAVCTSPCYGNRMADHHNAKDASRRNTYRHVLGEPLQADNSGQLQWGYAYRAFHWQAWQQVWRVLRPGGVLVLNISDHIRGGKVMPVTRFHELSLLRLGFVRQEKIAVVTPRQRHGANGNLRVDNEWVLVFRKDV